MPARRFCAAPAGKSNPEIESHDSAHCQTGAAEAKSDIRNQKSKERTASEQRITVERFGLSAPGFPGSAPKFCREVRKRHGLDVRG